MLSPVEEERMKSLYAGILALGLVFGCASALAQDKAAAPPTTVATALDHELSHLEHGMLGLAEAMPEDKYSFRPTQGQFNNVLDFAGQVKHVAEGIAMYASAIEGEKAKDAPASVKSKAELIAYMKSSFAAAHKALATINDQNMFTPIPPPFGKAQTTRFALGVSMVSHPNDHYGQMIEYLRMNGIVPPGSK
jgi:uncharacterized damage-inducible protein DinB